MATNLARDIKRAQAEVNRLEQTNQNDTERYQYWLNRLDDLKIARWVEFIDTLEDKYGPVNFDRKIIASGASQVTAYTKYGDYIQHIKLDLIPASVLAKMTVVADYTENNPPCEVCDSVGTQLHHWAPQHLFHDAEQWPKSYLCTDCHDRWHKTIINHWRPGNVKRAA